MKRLDEVGEDALIARMIKGLPRSSDLLVGPGDDCAVIGGPKDRVWQLLKTDCVIENVHFLRSTEPERVGWKALCRAISDIAAMAGEPGQALLTIGAPRDLELSWLDGFYAGVRKAARKFGVSIAGGETSRSPGPIFVNVALTGRVKRTHCVLRSGGKPGDLLYVTGRLGGSLQGKHLDFTPRLAEAHWLTEQCPPRAMMDLSDGLGADLPRLAEASGCGFMVAEEFIPCVEGVTPQQAISDGEDYELLFAVSPHLGTRLHDAWRRKFPRLPLTFIGELTRLEKTCQTTSVRGFDHFAPAK